MVAWKQGKGMIEFPRQTVSECPFNKLVWLEPPKWLSGQFQFLCPHLLSCHSELLGNTVMSTDPNAVSLSPFPSLQQAPVSRRRHTVPWTRAGLDVLASVAVPSWENATLAWPHRRLWEERPEPCGVHLGDGAETSPQNGSHKAVPGGENQGPWCLFNSDVTVFHGTKDTSVLSGWHPLGPTQQQQKSKAADVVS